MRTLSNTIELTQDDLDLSIGKVEAQYPDFRDVWGTPACCSDCRIPYDEWDMGKLDAYRRYEGHRWLRGDKQAHVD